ncbi:MAG TPA: GspH/FimT family pseudopilin [Gammaproteobacteria bacterium]|nr:GspH/FimT family pseudopilin [Gammaproteobacteria bacterium]
MRNQPGFTLIELIVVIAILAIFVTTAVPGFSRLVTRERRVSTVLSVVRALNFARAKAITTGRYIQVCKSGDAAQCDESVTWSDGWIVYVDRDEDSDLDAEERILRRRGAMDESVELTANQNAFTFRPTPHPSTAGSLFVCVGNQAYGEAVIISFTGRVRTAPEKADGSPVECG